MANVRVNSTMYDFAPARQLCGAHEAGAAKVAFDAPENPTLENDERQAGNYFPNGRQVVAKELSAENDEARCHGPPRQQKPGDVTRVTMTAPEMHMRVHDEPIQRNRQL